MGHGADGKRLPIHDSGIESYLSVLVEKGPAPRVEGFVVLEDAYRSNNCVEA
jgi:hypothetical protein